MICLKKTLLIALSLTIVTLGSVNAQDKEKPFSFGVKAGLNVSTISMTNDMSDDVDYDYFDYVAGFHAGIILQYMFTRNMGLESGLYYSQQGGKKEIDERIAGIRAKASYSMRPAYLQMPVLFIYKFHFSDDFSLFPSAGLYAGYGIAGKTKYEGDITGDFFDSNSESNFFQEGLNQRFDMGMSFGVNLQYKKFIAGISYDQGLVNIFEDEVYVMDYFNHIRGKSTLLNTCFKFSVGYLF